MQVTDFLMTSLWRRLFARLAFLWRLVHLLAVVASRSKKRSVHRPDPKGCRKTRSSPPARTKA